MYWFHTWLQTHFYFIYCSFFGVYMTESCVVRLTLNSLYSQRWPCSSCLHLPGVGITGMCVCEWVCTLWCWSLPPISSGSAGVADASSCLHGKCFYPLCYFPSLFYLIRIYLEARYQVSQAGLDSIYSRRWHGFLVFHVHLLNAGLMGMCHHTWASCTLAFC